MSPRSRAGRSFRASDLVQGPDGLWREEKKPKSIAPSSVTGIDAQYILDHYERFRGTFVTSSGPISRGAFTRLYLSDHPGDERAPKTVHRMICQVLLDAGVRERVETFRHFYGRDPEGEANVPQELR